MNSQKTSQTDTKLLTLSLSQERVLSTRSLYLQSFTFCRYNLQEITSKHFNVENQLTVFQCLFERYLEVFFGVPAGGS